MAEERNKADALAYMSGVIEHMNENNDTVTTEELVGAWNNALDERGVESDTLYLEA